MGSLEGACGNYGAFSVGTKFVVKHQVNCSLAYVFTTALPPMLVAADITVTERERQSERERVCVCEGGGRFYK